jgi:biotin carboxylase
MSNPVVIVDPVSSGSDLAPAFSARNIPVIAVRSTAYADSSDVGYAAAIQSANFLKVYDNSPDLVDDLRRLNPHAIIAGSETGVELADQLASVLTPQFANVPELARARRHKADMQQALADAGLAVIRTLNTASITEVMRWLAEQDLTDAALVLKPPASAGSDKVFHISPGGDWQRAFDHILSTPTALLGEPSETVIVQEQVTGTEYAVDTVSAAGKHVLAHLIRYRKTSADERMTVFDYTEFMPFDSRQHGELLQYASQTLDALGIRWGAAHSEIMLTAAGPRLIETGARMCGGPVLGLARAATGSSQLERVMEAYLDGEIRTTQYDFRQTVVPVFLIAPVSGVLCNVEILDKLRTLPTHLATHVWKNNGDYVERTVDFDTTLGIVALAGERRAVFADYARIRQVEAQLVVKSIE